MPTSVNVTPAELQSSAQKFRQELLLATTFGLDQIRKHMSLRKGIQYREMVGTFEYNGEPVPYNTTAVNGGDASIEGRWLEVYIAQIWEKFNPMDLIKTVYAGPGANSEALKKAPISQALLTAMASAAANKIFTHLWNASYDSSKKATINTFNGFDTITANEITAGKISVAKKNLIEVDAIDDTNVIDVLQSIYFAADEHLQEKKTKMFISRNIYNAYVRALKLEGSGISYYQNYEQVFLEGSNNLCELVPMSNKKDSIYIHLTTQKNMLIGVNQTEPDKEPISIKESEHPDVLIYYMKYFFGCQFETLRPEDILVAKIKTT